MIFCNRCGISLPKDSIYCSKCGHQLPTFEDAQILKEEQTNKEGAPEVLTATQQVASGWNAEIKMDNIPKKTNVWNAEVKTDNISKKSLSTARPWTRYWARIADTIVFGFVCGFIGGIFFPDFLIQTPELILGLILLVIIIPLEACLLSALGTTPGKWLLNIRVRTANETHLTFTKAFIRAINVWVKGLGCGIPLIGLATLITGYNTLQREGATSWDKKNENIVFYDRVPIYKTVIIICIFLGGIVLSYWE